MQGSEEFLFQVASPFANSIRSHSAVTLGRLPQVKVIPPSPERQKSRPTVS